MDASSATGSSIDLVGLWDNRYKKHAKWDGGNGAVWLEKVRRLTEVLVNNYVVAIIITIE